MHRTLREIRLRPLAILIVVAVLMILVDLAGCTDNPPYRKLVLQSPPATADCGTRYEQGRWGRLPGVQGSGSRDRSCSGGHTR